MDRKLLLLIFLTFPSVVFAREWFQGSIVLRDDRVLAGQLAVEVKYDVVLFRSDGKIQVFPAHLVATALFHDSGLNANRKFISIQQSEHSFKKFSLYEVVVSGEVAVLRRERFDESASDKNHQSEGYSYIIKFQDQLTPFVKFRSKIFPSLKQSSEKKFSEYVRENRLNPNDKVGAIRIIQYYNTQKRGASVL